jgi:hypothetical protein
MNTSKVLSDIEVLKVRVIGLQGQVEEMRRALLVLLESSTLDAKEKSALLSSIEAMVQVEPEAQAAKVQYEKTIQQLLDESQRPH